MNILADFERRGFVVLHEVITQSDRKFGYPELIGNADEDAGARNLLDQSWCRSLALRLKSYVLNQGLLSSEVVAVQCTLFQKTRKRLWRVPYHQDLSIPVRKKVSAPELSSWSEKEGVLYTQPPARVLEELVAVRIHLDDCGPDNGPLRVIPGSHRYGYISQRSQAEVIARGQEVVCCVRTGDLLIMRPLLLHASSKPTVPASRRVLHFLYGPAQLPLGLEWHQFV